MANPSGSRFKAAKGAPGSLVDVLCTVPACGTAVDEPVRIPIEVKLSHNPEAVTGLKAQLVDRYACELGSDVGLFVVGWMGTSVPRSYRPRWKSLADAKESLAKQAAEASGEGLDVRSCVIDLSLPMKAGGATKRVSKRTTGRTPANGQPSKETVPTKATSKQSPPKGKPKASVAKPTKAKAAKRTPGNGRAR